MELYVIIAICVASVLVIGLICFLIVNYKKMAKLKSIVKESYSTLEVFLEKRLEIVFNILSACSQNDIKNKEIGNLLSVATQLKQNLTTERRFSLESSLDNACKTSLTKLATINTDNSAYLKNLKNLALIQSEIISAKNYYNNNVEAYNKKVTKGASSFVATVFGLKKEYYLK